MLYVVDLLFIRRDRTLNSKRCPEVNVVRASQDFFLFRVTILQHFGFCKSQDQAFTQPEHFSNVAENEQNWRRVNVLLLVFQTWEEVGGQALIVVQLAV